MANLRETLWYALAFFVQMEKLSDNYSTSDVVIMNVKRFAKLSAWTIIVQILYALHWGAAFATIAGLVIITIPMIKQDDEKYLDFSRTLFDSSYIMFIWAFANSVTVAYYHVHEPRKYWIIGGICIMAAFTMEAFRSFQHLLKQQNNTIPAVARLVELAHNVFENMYNVVALAFLATAVYSFTRMTAIPWGVPWILFIPAFGYTVYRIEQSTKNHINMVYFTIFLCCLLTVTMWPADFTPAQATITCPLNRNVGVCGGAHMGQRVRAFPGCCCLTNHFLWNKHNRCTQCQAENFGDMDCCGNKITPDLEKHLGGPFQCICGQTPTSKKNKLVNNKCECHANKTCGTTCEITSVTCNVTQTTGNDTCHDLETHRPGSICLLVS